VVRHVDPDEVVMRAFTDLFRYLVSPKYNHRKVVDAAFLPLLTALMKLSRHTRRPFHWPEIFHRYLLGSGALLEHLILSRLRSVLAALIESLEVTWPSKLRKDPSVWDHRLLLLKKLHSFLKTHQIDPENSLLGLRPSALVMEAIVPFEAPDQTAGASVEDEEDDDEETLSPRAFGHVLSLAQDTKDPSSKRTSSMDLPRTQRESPRSSVKLARASRQISESSIDVGAIAVGDARKEDILTSDEKEEVAKLTTLDGLASLCVDIGDIPQGPMAARRLRKVARLLELTQEGRQRLAPGTLVIVLQEPNCVFARVASKQFHEEDPHYSQENYACGANATVFVTIDPFEAAQRSVVGVRARNVRSFPYSLWNLAESATQRHRLVHDELRELYEATSDFIGAHLEKHIGSAGVDAAFVNRVSTGDPEQIDLGEYGYLMNSIPLLESLSANDAFIESLLPEVRDFVEKRMATTEWDKMFIPLRNQAMDELKRYRAHLSVLIKWRLQNLVTQANFTLDELRKRVFRVIDGTRKNELTDWWLAHIERKTDLFLLSRGYVKDAVPDNYLQAPPNDMQAVEDNLKLIAEILDPLNDAHDIISFVYSLRHEIYEKMNVFARELKLVISMEFDLDPNQWDQDSVRELIMARLRDTSQIDRITLNYMLSALADLQYLHEMKQLEAGFSCKKTSSTGDEETNPGGFVMTNVVPVSGLIMARFHMIRNECMTVVELWKPTAAQSNKHLKAVDGAHLSVSKASVLADSRQTASSPHLVSVSHSLGDEKESTVPARPAHSSTPPCTLPPIADPMGAVDGDGDSDDARSSTLGGSPAPAAVAVAGATSCSITVSRPPTSTSSSLSVSVPTPSTISSSTSPSSSTPSSFSTSSSSSSPTSSSPCTTATSMLSLAINQEEQLRGRRRSAVQGPPLSLDRSLSSKLLANVGLQLAQEGTRTLNEMRRRTPPSEDNEEQDAALASSPSPSSPIQSSAFAAASSAASSPIAAASQPSAGAKPPTPPGESALLPERATPSPPSAPLQNLPRTRLSMTVVQEQEQKQKQVSCSDPARLLLQNLIDSELEYFQQLGLLVGLYLEPLQSEERSIFVRGLRRSPFPIFGNIATLYQLHQDFFPQLRMCEADWPAISPEEVFMAAPLDHMVRQYQYYLKQAHAGHLQLESLLRSSTHFQQFVDRCDQQVQAAFPSWTLSTLRQAPMRRVREYAAFWEAFSTLKGDEGPCTPSEVRRAQVGDSPLVGKPVAMPQQRVHFRARSERCELVANSFLRLVHAQDQSVDSERNDELLFHVADSVDGLDGNLITGKRHYFHEGGVLLPDVDNEEMYLFVLSDMLLLSRRRRLGGFNVSPTAAPLEVVEKIEFSRAFMRYEPSEVFLNRLPVGVSATTGFQLVLHESGDLEVVTAALPWSQANEFAYPEPLDPVRARESVVRHSARSPGPTMNVSDFISYIDQEELDELFCGSDSDDTSPSSSCSSGISDSISPTSPALLRSPPSPSLSPSSSMDHLSRSNASSSASSASPSSSAASTSPSPLLSDSQPPDATQSPPASWPRVQRAPTSGTAKNAPHSVPALGTASPSSSAPSPVLPRRPGSRRRVGSRGSAESQVNFVLNLDLPEKEEKESWLRGFEDLAEWFSGLITFGVPLHTLLHRRTWNKGRDLPVFVERCLTALSKQVKVDGLLLLEGRPTDVRRWRHLVENGNACPAFDKSVQPATIATLLREWLVALPEPIFTWDLSPSFLACRSLELQSNNLATSILRLIGLLPHHNQVLALQLLQLFSSICKRSSKKMTSQYANTFGSCFARLPKSASSNSNNNNNSGSSSAVTSSSSSWLFVYLVTHFSKLRPTLPVAIRTDK